MHIGWRAIAAALLVAGAACSEEPATSAPSPASVVIAPSAVGLGVGETVQLAASVRDRDGNALPDAVVAWSSANAAIATVTQAGLVTAIAVGSASVDAASGGRSARATVTVSASAPANLVKVSGDAQSATVGSALSNPLVVRLTDAAGNPMSGVAASWVVTAGGGMVGSATTTTDAAGMAQVPWTLGRTFLANAVTASAAGRAVTFTATGQGSGSLQGRLPFPADNPWNADISAEPVDPSSDALIGSCGASAPVHPDFGTVYNGAPNGIPYVVVRGTQGRVPVTFYYDDESDAGPYPVPADAPIEGGPDATGDRHVLVLDWDNWKLYELFDARPLSGGASWTAGSGAIFDLNSNQLRPAGWTSADAAGLPIFPGLVRYDEVMELGEIRHALRFTCPRTRRAYVHPARHWASSSTDPTLPPMGMRVRLKASVDISGFTANVQVIMRAMKRYGMLLADNGSSFFVSGAPDPRWNDQELRQLRQLRGSDFEVVRMGTIVTP